MSPLTGARPPQVVRLQQTFHDESAQSNGSSTELGSARQSPVVISQPKGNKKRKRALNAAENVRNVSSRLDNVHSPGVYIKEEPISPPLNAVTRLQLPQEARPERRLVPSARVPERAEINENDGRYVFEPLIQQERPYTPKRVVSNSVTQYLPRDDRDLRRIASTKNLRLPPSPGFDAPYSDPPARMIRASSTAHFVRAEPPPLPPPQFRQSVQPTVRDTRSQPRQVELTPDRAHVITMAPPLSALS